jgi:fructokinase
MDADQEMSYEIVAPVAWDFIGWEDGYGTAAASADAVVFGSLVMRNGVSRRTLDRLLDAARYRVFDVNLRAPHYSREHIFPALGKTDLLKLNQHELGVITGWTGKEPSADEPGNVSRLLERFPVTGVIVTRGKEGATYYDGDRSYHHPAYPVRVADTVGAGDAFLAAFLAARFRGQDIPGCLEAASVLGAFVAARKGACPEYQPREGELFLKPEDLTDLLTR